MKIEGEGPIFKYVRTSLKASFLPFQTSSFKSGVLNYGRALERMIQCIVFADGSDSLTAANSILSILTSHMYVAFEHVTLQKRKCLLGVTVSEGAVALLSHASW